MAEPSDRDREMARARLTDNGRHPQFCARMLDEADLARIIADARDEGRRAAMAWQPIETAPISRAPILGYCPEGEAVEQIYVIQFIAHSERGYWREAGGEQYAEYKPTHWQPLPEPPDDE